MATLKKELDTLGANQEENIKALKVYREALNFIKEMKVEIKSDKPYKEIAVLEIQVRISKGNAALINKLYKAYDKIPDYESIYLKRLKSQIDRFFHDLI